jgi:PEP-CTERM motif
LLVSGAEAVPFTDLGVTYDATFQLTSSGGGNSTYLIDITANTAGSTLPGSFLNALSIKIASSVLNFSPVPVSGPAGSAVQAGGISSGGCNGSGSGFICDHFTPILMPNGTVEVKLSETIATGTLFTGSNEASLKASYVTAAGGNAGITSEDFTLSPAPPAAVPEPGTLLLVGTSLAGLGGLTWRRRRTSA